MTDVARDNVRSNFDGVSALADAGVCTRPLRNLFGDPREGEDGVW